MHESMYCKKDKNGKGLAKTPQKNMSSIVLAHAPFVKNSKGFFPFVFAHTSLHRKFLLHLKESKES
jgi:hypothetical protein